jgi:8-oxo-dGTP pyrophosphatase MutT (NUDIX family)
MKHVTVVAAVIERNGKILCVQRGKSALPYISEKWEFPGGKIEANETEQETIVREIREELHMDFVVGEKLLHMLCPPSGGRGRLRGVTFISLDFQKYLSLILKRPFDTSVYVGLLRDRLNLRLS